MKKIKTTISPTNTILSVPFGTASYTISISAKAAAGTVIGYPTFTWREVY
jgi:hypothetical protein